MPSPSQQFPSDFIRAWKISIAIQNALRSPNQPVGPLAPGGTLVLSSDQFTQPLRTIFKISTRALLAYWTGEITIYNQNIQTLTQLQATGVQVEQLLQFTSVLSLGDVVSVSAGYKNDGSGAFNPDANKIYVGSVFQPLWTRENVVDLRVTLRCLQGLMQDALNWTGSQTGAAGITVEAGANAGETLNQIATSSGIPIAYVDDRARSVLGQSQSIRAQTFSSRPFAAINQVAKDNNLLSWVDHLGLNIRSLQFDPNTVPDIIYGPPNLGGNPTSLISTQGTVKHTLIGTPEQTQEGIVFRILLDAQPRIGQIVQVQPGTSISRAPIQFGQYPPRPLNQQGNYAIIGIDHFGDSRGGSDSWYTEITGVTQSFFPGFALAPNVI
jgi:hypothetical protein